MINTEKFIKDFEKLVLKNGGYIKNQSMYDYCIPISGNHLTFRNKFDAFHLDVVIHFDRRLSKSVKFKRLFRKRIK